MEITYKVGVIPPVEQIIELYNDAGLPRPTADPERIAEMYRHSNLVVTAWQGDQLAGVSRCITDWAWCCYLADLAVSSRHQKSGIGKKLIALTKEHAGERAMLLLLSVPSAMEYYPKAGFQKDDRAFSMKRTQ